MNDAKVQALVNAIRERPVFMDKMLAKIRKEIKPRSHESDFVWKGILRGLFTWGKVPKHFNFDEAYEQVTYNKLKNCSANDRIKKLNHAFEGKWRFPERKVNYACRNLEMIEKEGGGASVSRKARKCGTRQEKLEFIDKFAGVGPKYARNFWMDVYDPDFRNSIAVDQRILNVLDTFGSNPELSEYNECEKFFKKIAKRSGVNAWTLDRLLFNFTLYFIWAIEAAD